MAYIGVAAESLDLLLGHAGSETTEVLVDEIGISSNARDDGVGLGRELIGAGLELHNVVTLNKVNIAGDNERSTLLGSGESQRQDGEKDAGTHLDCCKGREVETEDEA